MREVRIIDTRALFEGSTLFNFAAAFMKDGERKHLCVEWRLPAGFTQADVIAKREEARQEIERIAQRDGLIEQVSLPLPVSDCLESASYV